MVDEIVYTPGAGSGRPREIFFRFWLVALGVVAVMAAATGRWVNALAQAVLGLAGWAIHRYGSKRVFRANHDGIDARPVMKEPWRAIASVKVPTQWDECVMVRMAADGEERRTGFPVTYAEQLAQIGGKPLV